MAYVKVEVYANDIKFELTDSSNWIPNTPATSADPLDFNFEGHSEPLGVVLDRAVARLNTVVDQLGVRDQVERDLF